MVKAQQQILGVSHMLHSKKKIYYLLFCYTEPCCSSEKKEVLGVFLLLHGRTIFEVIYYDQHSRRLCSSLEADCMLSLLQIMSS